jgi:hypothetical protein
MSLLPFRNALVTVYNADSAVQAVTGRTTLNLMPRSAQRYEENLPVLTYFIVTSPQKRGTKGARRILVQLEAWAKDADDNVFTQMETLLDRAEALFTGDTLAGQSVDAYRVRVASRQDGAVEDGVRSIRADLSFDVMTA